MEDKLFESKLKEEFGKLEKDYDGLQLVLDKLNKPNRLFSTEPKLGEYWCWKCDRGVMSVVGKCGRCGAKNKNKRRKK